MQIRIVRDVSGNAVPNGPTEHVDPVQARILIATGLAVEVKPSSPYQPGVETTQGHSLPVNPEPAKPNLKWKLSYFQGVPGLNAKCDSCGYKGYHTGPTAHTHEITHCFRPEVDPRTQLMIGPGTKVVETCPSDLAAQYQKLYKRSARQRKPAVNTDRQIFEKAKAESNGKLAAFNAAVKQGRFGLVTFPRDATDLINEMPKALQEPKEQPFKPISIDLSQSLAQLPDCPVQYEVYDPAKGR